MCVDMGGGSTLSGKGGSQGVHEEGVHRGFTKRGVHVKPVNPPWQRRSQEFFFWGGANFP